MIVQHISFILEGNSRNHLRKRISKKGILTFLLLLLIVVIFLLSRTFKIDQIPESVYWDEASIGYNAYSVLKTGRDEWGAFLPIHFQAFGEYKLPIYIYTVAFFEMFLGLSPAAVRLPAVIYSLGSLIILFLITKKIFLSKRISIMSTFLFAITPWYFIFSRTGYEVTAGLFFLLLGIYLFLYSFSERWYLVSSVASFILALYSYNSFRIIIPLLLIYLYVWYAHYQKYWRASFWQEWYKYLSALLVAVLGIIPIILLYTSETGLKRFNDTSIFANGVVTIDRLVVFSLNYLEYFSVEFLFFTGDNNLRSHTGNVGQLYWIQFPFIIFGLLYLLKRSSFAKMLILFLLLISPIPAAITRENPHALRSILLYVPYTVLTALGIQYAVAQLRLKKIIVVCILGFFFLLFGIYLQKFFGDYQTHSAESWQFGYAQALNKYANQFGNYDHVVISDRYNHPYIFYLFYAAIDPLQSQQSRILNKQPRIETSLVKKIGNVHFEEVHFADFPKGRSLVFAHPSERLDEILPIEEIWHPDKTVAFYVYEYEKK